jgi:signal transduction histidine kinase
VLSVRDEGSGVPEESLAEIFRPFYRVDDSRTRETGGAGLGLAITQRAVSLHGGNISAANVSGGGFVVEIRLPLATSLLTPVDES